MEVVELTNLVRRESPLLYRRTYTATAVLLHAPAVRHSVPIEFVLEHSPIGPVQIRVKFLDVPDFPPVPATAR
ncbi:MAG: hypothetical protein ACOC2N_07145, partial [Spirochaetota bacterium]